MVVGSLGSLAPRRHRRRIVPACALIILGVIVMTTLTAGWLWPSTTAVGVIGRFFWPFRRTASAKSSSIRIKISMKKEPPSHFPESLTQRRQAAILGSQKAIGSGVLSSGRVTTEQHMDELEELLLSLKQERGDAVVQLATAVDWDDGLEKFTSEYDAYAEVYKNTRFLKLLTKQQPMDDVRKKVLRLAGDILPVGPQSIFLAYSQGRLVSQWTGTDGERFKSHLESTLSSAKQVAEERAMQKASPKFPSGFEVAEEAALAARV